MRGRRWTSQAESGLVAFALILSARDTVASAPPRIAYRAPPHCPDATVFIGRVRTRTPRAELGGSCTGSDCFDVQVTSDPSSSAARVEYAAPSGERVVRTVRGETCDEVVSAAALIAALAVEAGAAPSGEEEVPPPSLGVEQNPEPESPAPERSRGAAEAATPKPAASAPAEGTRSLLWGAGATAAVDTWTAAGLSYGGAVFAEIGGRPPFHLVRLSLRATTASASIEGRNATFSQLAGRLTGCPVSLLPIRELDLLPCAAVDVGLLAGQGEASLALPNPKSASIIWASAEAVLLLRWHVVPPLTFEFAGEVGFPLVRHTFIFEGPERIVTEVPTVGAGITAGAAVRFH